MCKCMILHFCDKNIKEQQMKWTRGASGGSLAAVTFWSFFILRVVFLAKRIIHQQCDVQYKLPYDSSFIPTFIHGPLWIFFVAYDKKKKSNKKVESVTNVRKVCVNVITSCLSLEVEYVLCFQDLRNEREWCHGPEGQCRKWVRPNAMQLVCEHVMGPLPVRRLALDAIFPRDLPKHKI